MDGPGARLALLEAATHARADLQTDQLLEAGLDLVLKESAKRRGLTDRPQKKPRPSKRDGHIPAHVKREVMARSGGRCEATLANGERCGSTHDPEFHHRTARALGGKGNSADQVMLTCRGHNELFARQDFGHEVMDRPRPTGRGGGAGQGRRGPEHRRAHARPRASRAPARAVSPARALGASPGLARA